MDRVRFGRALGAGARLAVKTLATAVDAATAENPSGGRKNASANTGQAGPVRGGADLVAQPPARTVPDTAARKAAHTAARKVVEARGVRKGLKRGSRRFGEAVWGPFARLSGVLWLEVSGVFFGVFALFALGAVLHLRGQWHSSAGNAGEHRNLLVAVAMLVVFGYFCVSNFVRARRRERGR
jgi:hypothetical protein